MSINLSKKFTLTMSRFFQKIMILDRAEKLCQGVTLSQAYAIGTIQRREILTMNELSQELGLAISTLTRIIDVMVRNEIVCRYHSEQDRRKVNICLTEKGKQLAANLEICGQKFWSKIFDQIPDEKKKEVTDNLNLLLKAIEGVEQVCCNQD